MVVIMWQSWILDLCYTHQGINMPRGFSLANHMKVYSLYWEV